MRITVIAVGTRGDVQPMLALAAGLHAAGHHVRFATEKNYAPQATQAGLEYYELTGDSEKFYSGRAGVAFRESLDKSFTEYRRFWHAYFAPAARQHLREAVAPCVGADLLVCQPWAGLGPSLGEKFDIPCAITSVFPVPELPTRDFPFTLFNRARADLTPDENWRTWRRAIPFLRAGWHAVQPWRTDVLGLKAQTFREYLEDVRRTPHVLGYSPLLVPKPAEWDDRITVTGFWFLESAGHYEPPPELEEFLAGGEPPLVVGFGSHVSREPAALTDAVLEALRMSGRRGILITGWGGLRCAEPPPNVFCSRGVPYDWLLPRTLGLVHHGGAGTTAIALRAGVPQVITPFGYDQTFWAHRVAALGVSSAPIPAKQLTAEDLAAAIGEISTDDSVRSRAAAVGRAVRGEDGIGQAVTAIEQLASLKEDSCAHF